MLADGCGEIFRISSLTPKTMALGFQVPFSSKKAPSRMFQEWFKLGTSNASKAPKLRLEL